jgi:hypothetical protein
MALDLNRYTLPTRIKDLLEFVWGLEVRPEGVLLCPSGSPIEEQSEGSSEITSGRAMRVLMLARAYPPFALNGVARHNFELLHGLQRAGTEVTAVTIPARKFEPLPGGVKVYREVRIAPDPEDSKSSLPAVVRKTTAAFVRTAIQAAIVEGKPDLIHCQAQVASEAAEILGRIWQIPYVLTVHLNQLALVDEQVPWVETSDEVHAAKVVSSQIAGPRTARTSPVSSLR